MTNFALSLLCLALSVTALLTHSPRLAIGTLVLALLVIASALRNIYRGAP